MGAWPNSPTLVLPSSSTLATLELPSVSSRNVVRRVAGARRLTSDAAFWDHFNMLGTLGRGCFGSVLQIRSRKTRLLLAVKVVDSLSTSAADDSSRQAHREPELLREARHRHVVDLCEVFQTDTTLFLVTEACTTDLQRLARASPDGILGAAATRGLVKQLLSAVGHLHSLAIVHRDIKAANVLLAPSGEARLSDFGLATVLPDGELSSPAVGRRYGLIASTCGTHDFLAPEMVRCAHGEADGYSIEVDLWGVGLLVYGLVVGGNPFERDTDIATIAAILSGRFAWTDRERCTPARRLVEGLLAVCPVSRLTAAAALEEPWLQRGGDGQERARAPPARPASHSGWMRWLSDGLTGAVGATAVGLGVVSGA